MMDEDRKKVLLEGMEELGFIVRNQRVNEEEIEQKYKCNSCGDSPEVLLNIMHDNPYYVCKHCLTELIDIIDSAYLMGVPLREVLE